MKLPKAKKLPSGSWNIQVMVDGKRISITEDTEKEAIAKAAQVKAGLIQKAKDFQTKNIILNDALSKYIENRSNILSPSTIRSYKETQKNRIQKLLSMKVRDITEEHLQIQINEEAKAGHSTKTIKNDISLAVSVISKYKTIDATRLKYPQRLKKEHVYLQGSQIASLITACEGDIAEIPILLGIWLGLRRSEILGLCWDCVNFDNMTISIKRALVRGADSNLVLKDYTKNEGSQRTLSLPGYIADKLKAYTPEDKRVGKIFDTKNASFIYARLQIICKKAGIPFPGVHGLRHTNASIMMSLGLADKIMMSRGGWSTDYTMKTVYFHLFQSDKENADKKMDDFFLSILQTDLQTKREKP